MIFTNVSPLQSFPPYGTNTFTTKCSWWFRRFNLWKVGIGNFVKNSPSKIAYSTVCVCNRISINTYAWWIFVVFDYQLLTCRVHITIIVPYLFIYRYCISQSEGVVTALTVLNLQSTMICSWRHYILWLYTMVLMTTRLLLP